MKLSRKLTLFVSVLSLSMLVGCSSITKESVIKDLKEGKFENFAADYGTLEDLTNTDKDEIGTSVEKAIEQLTIDYIAEEKTEEVLDDYIMKLDLIWQVDEYKDIIDITEKMFIEIYESNTAFNKGNEYLENKKYEKAISEYTKVIESDSENYKNAQSKINESQAEIAKLKPAAEVIKANLTRNIIDNQMANIQFENLSDKVIKEINFSVFAYDKEGYPVKVQFNYDDYMSCKLEQTLQPGEKSNSDWEWNIYNEGTTVSKLIVSIDNVEFYEGETWENPMYDLDIEKYVGKPLK